MDLLVRRRALLSVTDKTGLADFARALVARGVELVSTGGTMKMLRDQGLSVTSVSDVTGFPEILGGRVKTLHPHVHGGVLADKDDPAHLETLERFKIKPFDLVCVNLYAFALAAQKALNLKAAVEEIDIGGPTLLRASAKNFHSVLVVPGVEPYGRVLAELEASGGFSLPLRKDMAAATFRLVSGYDAMIADYLAGHTA